jgi:hypothetical protein
MNKPSITRIVSCIQPHLTNEEINECLEGKRQIEWVMGSVSDKKELWACDKNRINVLAGPLSKEEMTKYLIIKNNHYVIYGNQKHIDRRCSASANGIYFFWCCANSEPYIAVTYNRNYCSVSIDLITLEDKKEKILSEECSKKMFELLDNSTIRRANAIFSVGPVVMFAHSNSILKIRGPIVAAELYHIWQTCKIDKQSDCLTRSGET